ncbi:ABC transporter permease [Cellulosimicrobium funkei]|nr:ABC transporter permease [Cellulosimicrobium funkei]
MSTQSTGPKLALDGPGRKPRKPPRLVQEFRKALFSTPATIIASIYLFLLVLAAIFAPVITRWVGVDPYSFNEDTIDPALGGIPLGQVGGMSAEHPFGVEPLNGRDLFARVLYGARLSLSIAGIATLLTATIGVVLGVLAGYVGGRLDQMISRLMDFVMAFPALIFMIAILSAVPQVDRMVMLVVVLSFFGWPQIARVVRGQVLSVKNREYVEAATASGGRNRHIIFQEVLPNVSGSIIVMVTLMIPTYIATEAGLSFLGVGVRPPDPSWGQMIYSAVPWFSTAPHFFIVPGIFLSMTILACMIVGDEYERRLGRVIER